MTTVIETSNGWAVLRERRVLADGFRTNSAAWRAGLARRTRGAANSTGAMPGFTAGPAKAECGKNVTAPRGHDKAPR
jgi:hypothetical protein